MSIAAVVFCALLATLNVFQFLVIAVLLIRQKGIKLEVEVASFVRAGWYRTTARTREIRNRRSASAGKAISINRASMDTEAGPNKSMAMIITTSIPPSATNNKPPPVKPKPRVKPQIIFTAYDLAAETGQQQLDNSEDDPYHELSDAYAMENSNSSQNAILDGEYDTVVSVEVNKKPTPKPRVDRNKLKQPDEEDVYEYPNHCDNNDY